ncbi:hypothetical protein ABE38_01520 [Brevibacillus agri]|nr:hypothetical protein [Brevibacillus agri]
MPCDGVNFSIAQSQELMPASGSMSSPTYEASFSRLHKNLDRLAYHLHLSIYPATDLGAEKQLPENGAVFFGSILSWVGAVATKLKLPRLPN